MSRRQGLNIQLEYVAIKIRVAIACIDRRLRASLTMTHRLVDELNELRRLIEVKRNELNLGEL